MSTALQSNWKSVRPEQLSSLAVPLLADLSQSDTADLLRHGRNLKVAPKTCLCTAGDTAENLFLLLKGRVKFSRSTSEGDEILLCLLTPGQSFGLATVLPDPLKYLGTAQAESACELVVWNHSQMLQLSGSHPQIKTNALRIALLFVASLADRHSSLFEGDASHRIARVLVDVGRRSGSIHPEGIDVRITNEQLGSLADVSRFTASRVLSTWNKAGVITKERETVRIHSPEALLSD